MNGLGDRALQMSHGSATKLSRQRTSWQPQRGPNLPAEIRRPERANIPESSRFRTHHASKSNRLTGVSGMAFATSGLADPDKIPRDLSKAFFTHNTHIPHSALDGG